MSKKKLIFITILLIIGILTCLLLVAGGVYYFQKQKIGDINQEKQKLEQEKKQLENEIGNLKKEIENLQTQIKEEKQKKEEEQKTDEYAGWKTYKNNIYEYEIKYPQECQVMPATSEVERVVIQGDIKEKGWPSLEIHHYDTVAFNPPEGTNIINWLDANWSGIYENIPDAPNTKIDGIEAVEIYTPQSPQAYSTKTIFFIKNNKLFGIFLNDVDGEEASGSKIYERMAKSFNFIE